MPFKDIPRMHVLFIGQQALIEFNNVSHDEQEKQNNLEYDVSSESDEISESAHATNSESNGRLFSDRYVDNRA
jgi:hypothetical protein